MSSAHKILFRTSDGETFELDENVALQCQTIKPLIEDGCADDGVPIPNVNSRVMAKVVQYCKKHAEHQPNAAAGSSSSSAAPVFDAELKAWDEEFVKMDYQLLFELILAASYLNIDGLMNLTCQAVADKIHNKTPNYVRKVFKIANDFTQEESDQLMEETAWTYEGIDQD